MPPGDPHSGDGRFGKFNSSIPGQEPQDQILKHYSNTLGTKTDSNSLGIMVSDKSIVLLTFGNSYLSFAIHQQSDSSNIRRS